MSLLGVKRTCSFALHMSASDPKRTSASRSIRVFPSSGLNRTIPYLSLGGGNETARVHHTSRRHGCRVADLCVRPTSEVADNRISGHGRTVGMDPLDRRLCPAAT